jgi:hypothetical protein
VSTTITRAALAQFVAEGIAHQNAGSWPFTPAEEDALREVARTTPRVAWGQTTADPDGCGCPLTQAGIIVTGTNSRFWGTFDKALWDKARAAAGVLTVTDD